jgi:hypothetical protein
MKKKDFNIIRVPLEKSSNPTINPTFPDMPRMYLELVENKDKVIPDLVNSEYSPDTDTDTVFSIKSDKSARSQKSESEKSDYSTSNGSGSTVAPLEHAISIKSDSSDTISIASDISTDTLRARFADLVDNGDERQVSAPKTHTLPPSLNQLEKQGKIGTNRVYRNVSNPTKSERETEDSKRELLFKFELMQKKYPNAKLPEFSIHSDYDDMLRTYDNTLRRLSIDMNVDRYKTYLVGGCMLVEQFLQSRFKFDMEGFTQQQVLCMAQYERLLIELGEKTYVPKESSWPVEFRLGFMILFNAAVFILYKIILKKTGANLLNMMNLVTTPTEPPKPKTRMKGPSINIDDIPDVDEMEEERQNKT